MTATLSALCLSAETSSLTAIVNDYPPTELFARQVQAHGRAGDVLLKVLSTSGRSPNILAAAERGRACGLHVGVDRARPQPAGRSHRRLPECAGTRHRHGAGIASGRAASGVRGLRPGGGSHGGRGGRMRPRIVVVGDALLDVEIEGTASRLTPMRPRPSWTSRVSRCAPRCRSDRAVRPSRRGRGDAGLGVGPTVTGGDCATNSTAPASASSRCPWMALRR